jgi:hypothetical protein
MDKYNTIAEYLQEAVNTGELSLEEASMINDAAYERYVESEDSDMITVEEALDIVEDILFEGNAYNRVAAKLKKDDNSFSDKKDRISNLLGQEKTDQLLSNAEEKLEQRKRKFRYDADYSIGNYVNRGSKNENTVDVNKCMKRNWMRNNGNRGESPEKKYVAGRYLKAQKELRELDPGRKRSKLEITNKPKNKEHFIYVS